MAKSKKSPYFGTHLLLNNRFWILLFSGSVSLLAWLGIWLIIPDGELRTIRLQQTYGFISLIYLYLALLATPLTSLFKSFPGRDGYLHARRAIGVSAFFFGLLHTLIAFFGQLQGFAGLEFLSGRYNLALLLGLAALLILLAMAATSFDAVIERMGFPRWKKLHRLIYIGGFAILIHILMLGTHFIYGSSPLARVTLGLVIILLILEGIRIDKKLKEKVPQLRHFGLASMVVLHLVFLSVGFVIGRQAGNLPSLSQHAGHNDQGGQGQYVDYEPVSQLGNRQIRINSEQISRAALISGDQVVRFSISQLFDDLLTHSCFLVNQQTYQYTHGLSKLVNGRDIDCLPLGDSSPPEVGHYTIYLRLEFPQTPQTIPYNLEITL